MQLDKASSLLYISAFCLINSAVLYVWVMFQSSFHFQLYSDISAIYRFPIEINLQFILMQLIITNFSRSGENTFLVDVQM